MQAIPFYRSVVERDGAASRYADEQYAAHNRFVRLGGDRARSKDRKAAIEALRERTSAEEALAGMGGDPVRIRQARGSLPISEVELRRRLGIDIPWMPSNGI
jgi:hypothetical protein